MKLLKNFYFPATSFLISNREWLLKFRKIEIHFNVLFSGSIKKDTMVSTIRHKKKNCERFLYRSSFVGLPGLEPGKTGPESVVLPLHHSPIFFQSFIRTTRSDFDDAKIRTFSIPTNFFEVFFIKKHIFPIEMWLHRLTAGKKGGVST